MEKKPSLSRPPENSEMKEIYSQIQALGVFFEQIRKGGIGSLSADLARVTQKVFHLRAMVSRFRYTSLSHSIFQFTRLVDLEWTRLNLKQRSPERTLQVISFFQAFSSRLGHMATAYLRNPKLYRETLDFDDQIKRILIVDDSKMVQSLLSSVCSIHPQLKLVGVASNVDEARKIMENTHVDSLILDVQMPGVDGFTFLSELGVGYPLPITLVSSLGSDRGREVFNALYQGACDYIPKSSLQISSEIARKIYMVANSSLESLMRFHLRSPRTSATLKMDTPKTLAIGVSTGGTRTLLDTLTHFQKEIPPTLILQTIVPEFSEVLVQHLQNMFPFRIKEAEQDELLEQGKVLICPKGVQMTLEKGPDGIQRVNLKRIEGGASPSLNIFLSSVAQALGANSIGLLLAGSGTDGARGLLDIKKTGGYTLAQSESDCIDPTLTRTAIQIGGALKIETGDALGETLTNLLSEVQEPSKREDLSSSPKNTRIKCLIVDDSPLIRAVIRHDLQTMGYFDFEEAGNGVSAWTQLTSAIEAKVGFNLVVCDQNMPEMSGRELLKKIRTHEILQDLPFILVTSETEKKGVLEASRFGVSDFVLKPISADLLREKVTSILSRVQS